MDLHAIQPECFRNDTSRVSVRDLSIPILLIWRPKINSFCLFSLRMTSHIVVSVCRLTMSCCVRTFRSDCGRSVRYLRNAESAPILRQTVPFFFSVPDRCLFSVTDSLWVVLYIVFYIRIRVRVKVRVRIRPLGLPQPDRPFPHQWICTRYDQTVFEMTQIALAWEISRFIFF